MDFLSVNSFPSPCYIIALANNHLSGAQKLHCLAYIEEFLHVELRNQKCGQDIYYSNNKNQ